MGSRMMSNRSSVVSERSTIIREFQFPDDYFSVYELWKACAPGVHLRRSDEPEEIAKKLIRDPDLFLVAEEGGHIIGSVIGGFDGRRGMVYHLAVSPSSRKNGVGEALMNLLEERLRAKGCIRCYLLVTEENDYAVNFYEKRGWSKMPLYAYGKDL